MSQAIDTSTEQIIDIPLADIAPSFGNDRTVFDEEKIAELAASIKANGLAQPITVRPLGNGKFQLIAGERRYRATKHNGSETIRAIVREMDDETAAAIMLAENTARADIDPIDEANAFKRRMTDYGWDIAHTAKQAGKRADYVTRRLALLKLTPELQHMVRRGQFGVQYGEILANACLDNNRQRIALKNFNAATVKSVEVFTAICAELALQQAQVSMFDGLFSIDPGVQTKQEYHWKQPPLPKTDKPPVVDDSPYNQIQAQIKFWEQAADQWDRLKCKSQKNLCLAAAEGLRGVLEYAPRHTTKNAKRATKGATQYIVYEIAQ